MSEPSVEWWVKVKPPGPGADYRWLGMGRAPVPAEPSAGAPAAPPAGPPDVPPDGVRAFAAQAAEVGGTGELTVFLFVRPDGAPALYVEGLRAPCWPTDHQGRDITASLVGLGAPGGAANGEPLARALWAISRPTAARQSALERVVRFGTGGSGPVGVDAAAWQRFLRTATRLPAPHPVDQVTSRRGDEAALADAVRDVTSVLQPGPAAAPPGLLLAVSPLLDDDWCERRRPWRAVGPALAARTGTAAGAPRRLPGGRQSASRPAAPPARTRGIGLPGRAEAARLVKSVFSVLALAALCAAVLLIVL